MERLAMEAQQREQLSAQDSPDVERPKHEKNPINRPKKTLKSSTSLNSNVEKDDKKSKKKPKRYCICQTPYDKARWECSISMMCRSWVLIPNLC